MSDNPFRVAGVTGEVESEIVGYLNRGVMQDGNYIIKDEVLRNGD